MASFEATSCSSCKKTIRTLWQSQSGAKCGSTGGVGGVLATSAKNKGEFMLGMCSARL